MGGIFHILRQGLGLHLSACYSHKHSSKNEIWWCSRRNCTYTFYCVLRFQPQHRERAATLFSFARAVSLSTWLWSISLPYEHHSFLI